MRLQPTPTLGYLITARHSSLSSISVLISKALFSPVSTLKMWWKVACGLPLVLLSPCHKQLATGRQPSCDQNSGWSQGACTAVARRSATGRRPVAEGCRDDLVARRFWFLQVADQSQPISNQFAISRPPVANRSPIFRDCCRRPVGGWSATDKYSFWSHSGCIGCSCFLVARQSLTGCSTSVTVASPWGASQTMSSLALSSGCRTQSLASLIRLCLILSGSLGLSYKSIFLTGSSQETLMPLWASVCRLCPVHSHPV